MLPTRRFVTSATDLPFPATLGDISVERVWTGQRGGLFGRGWETVWDIRLEDGRLVGALPGEPTSAPAVDSEVELSDGTVLHLDSDGRVQRACRGTALCASVERRSDAIVLTSGDRRLDLVVGPSGVVVQARSDDGRNAEFAYRDGYLVSSGASVNVAYVYENELLTAINSEGDVRSVEYDAQGSATAFVDRDGVRVVIEGSPEDVTVSEDGLNPIVYSFEDEMLIRVESAGVVRLLREVKDGSIIREDRPPDGVSIERTGTNAYTMTSRRTDRPDVTTSYEMDSRGHLVRAAGPFGTATAEYDERGRRLATTTAGATTRLSYDDDGLLASVVDEDGYAISLTRDRNGQVVALTDGTATTAFAYDSSGHVAEQIDGGQVEKAAYDMAGRIAQIAGADSEVRFGYDERGRLASIGEDGISSIPPDAGLTDPLPSTALPRDGSTGAAEVPAEIEQIGDGTVVYRFASGRSDTFDAQGRLVESDVSGARTRWQYDEFGRVIALTSGDGEEYEAAYTSGGRLDRLRIDGVEADLTWDGDRLVAVDVEGGGRYQYEYDGGGRLAASTVGPAAWSYEYGADGALTSVISPLGTETYQWERGRPTGWVDRAGAKTTVEWEGDRLLAVSGPTEEESVSLNWGADGRLAELSSNGEMSFGYDESGRIVSVDRSSGDDVDVVYAPDGRVDSVRSGNHEERWSYEGDVVESVSMDGDEYQLDWAVSGILARVTRSGETLLETTLSKAGRPLEVRGADGELQASMRYEGGLLVSAATRDEEISVRRDREGRIVSATSPEGVDLAVSYTEGALESVRSGDISIGYQYSDGMVTSSSLSDGDETSTVRWDNSGRPVDVQTPSGEASFEYTAGIIEAISYDDLRREVTIDDEGRARADGTGGELLGDLFTPNGQFRLGAGELTAVPVSPLLGRVPVEFGIDVPKLETGRDIVSSALIAATPIFPSPILAGDIVANALDLATFPLRTEQLPLTPARTIDSKLSPGAPGDVFEEALGSTETANLVFSVDRRLAADQCLLCRVWSTGGVVLGGLASGARYIVGLINDSEIVQAALGTLSMWLPRAVALACVPAAAVCTANAGGIASAVVVLETAARLATTLQLIVGGPLRELITGLRGGDPVASTLAAFAVITSLPKGLTRAGSIASKLSCRLKNIVCISLSRFGSAAEHVLDAQQTGYGRLLTLNRTGAAGRRVSALRGIDLALGVDRDEYPPAFMRRGGQAVSVRYVDPSANRALGAALQRMTEDLADGTRIFVRVIG